MDFCLRVVRVPIDRGRTAAMSRPFQKDIVDGQYKPLYSSSSDGEPIAKTAGTGSRELGWAPM